MIAYLLALLASPDDAIDRMTQYMANVKTLSVDLRFESAGGQYVGVGKLILEKTVEPTVHDEAGGERLPLHREPQGPNRNRASTTAVSRVPARGSLDFAGRPAFRHPGHRVSFAADRRRRLFDPPDQHPIRSWGRARGSQWARRPALGDLRHDDGATDDDPFHRQGGPTHAL